jgi:hypothetical protein
LLQSLASRVLPAAAGTVTSQPVLAPLLGLAAGGLHVVTGPDHLAAVSALAAGSPRRSWILGLRWGLGHSLGIVLLGALALILQRGCGIDTAAGWSDRVVGAVMVLLGLWALRRALGRRLHEHPHSHDGHTHEHAHVHIHLGLHDGAHRHTHAPYAVGILHGFGGGAQLFGVLPALAFPDLAGASLYFASFVVGSLAAMAGFASVVGALSRSGPQRFGKAFAATCALASCAVGIWWLVG